MSDQKLWDELRANPANAKSSIQLAAEQREQERLRALQGVKPTITAAARESAAQRFKSIQAQKAIEKTLEQDSIVAQREQEIRQQIADALKDVTSAAEQA